jgi:hypothetical protein
MLTELARDVAREAVFRSEREASRADAGSREVLREERAWESALGDGLA